MILDLVFFRIQRSQILFFKFFNLLNKLSKGLKIVLESSTIINFLVFLTLSIISDESVFKTEDTEKRDTEKFFFSSFFDISIACSNAKLNATKEIFFPILY